MATITRLKRCTRCDVPLPLSAFNLNRSKPDNHQDACRACMTLYKREWLERVCDNPYWINRRRQQWRATDRKRQGRRHRSTAESAQA